MSIQEELKMITCETLEQLETRQWALVSDFFSEAELQALKKTAHSRWQNGQFGPAQVGRSQDRKLANQVRSDWTSWLDLTDPEFQWFADKVNELKDELNRSFFLGIRQFECHFARYAEGQFYQEHIDQSPRTSPLHGERVISFVLYLNENWQPGYGGELSIRHPADSEVRIEPRWGQLALFRSDTIPHAVLPAQRERWSLTGWFRRS